MDILMDARANGNDAEFLRWVAARLITKCGESENNDIIQRLKSIAYVTPDNQVTYFGKWLDNPRDPRAVLYHRIAEYHSQPREGQTLSQFLGWTWEEWCIYVETLRIPERFCKSLR